MYDIKIGEEIEEYGDGFKMNDLITMIHNPTDKTLTFNRLRDGMLKKYEAIKMNNDNRKYKMCVYLFGKDSSVELLSCDQYIDDAQQNDDNDDIVKHEKSEEKQQELRHDKDLSLVIAMSLKEEQERKEKASKKFETEETELLRQLLNAQKDEIKELKQAKETEINQIKHEKEDYVAANQRQRSRIISLEKDNETLRNERDLIQSKLTELSQQNNTLKVKPQKFPHLHSSEFANFVHTKYMHPLLYRD